MEKSKLNKKAKEFKPKSKPAPPPSQPPVTSKYFHGVLPGHASNQPVPTKMPPGMEVKLENGKLVIPDSLPHGLKMMFEQAYEEGKFDDIIMEELGKAPKQKAGDYELSPEEEAMAEEFLAEQEAMEICPFYLQGTCQYGEK